MEQTKALIAMSGGVDSSVAAFLMQDAGFSCVGGTMRLCDHQLLGKPEDNTDPTADAKSVAERLGIPFYVFDATRPFREKVVDDFVACYEHGGTPNPCIVCNRHLKFSYLLDEALGLGCDFVVTGHYARVRKEEATGRYVLYKAADKDKDQTYFLACLNQHQLSHVKLPLGELTKAEVREIAQQQGFLNARKKDSQDICFIPDGDYRSFLGRYTGKDYPAGNYLDLSGKVVGSHTGAVGYTIGQRKGLGIALGEPVYVCSKDMANNTVTVGPNEALFSTTLIAEDMNFLPFSSLESPLRVKARIRYRHTEQPATVYPMENGTVKVIFDEAQRAITTGQAVVFYDGDMVIGSGTISQVL